MDDTDITAMLRDSVVDFLEGHQTLSSNMAVSAYPQPLNRELWLEMAELGWLGLALPEEAGGSGLGLREAAVLTELFGQYAFNAPYIAAILMPSVILAASKEALANELAAEMTSGKRLVTLAWQEAVGEIDPVEPTCRYLGNGRIDGRKCFVPAVESDSVLLVSAQSNDELVIVAIEEGTEGVSTQPSTTALGTVSEITLDSARILGDDPLLRGSAAKRSLRRSLEGGRIALAAQLAGLASGCLSKTLTHTSERVQFGKPLGSLQSVRHRCVDMYMAIRLANASWRKALDACESAPDTLATQADVSAAKARCAETAMQVTRDSVQLHGAMGFTEEGGIGRYLRAAMAGSGWLGAPSAHRRRFLSAKGTRNHV